MLVFLFKLNRNLIYTAGFQLNFSDKLATGATWTVVNRYE